MDLGKVFQPRWPGTEDRPPQRRAYRMIELKRWRDYPGVALNLEPKFFPVPAEAAATPILAVLARHGVDSALDIAGDCLRAIRAEDRTSRHPQRCRKSVARAGSTPTRCWRMPRPRKSRQDCDAFAGSLIARGVFGSPTYVLRTTVPRPGPTRLPRSRARSRVMHWPPRREPPAHPRR